MQKSFEIVTIKGRGAKSLLMALLLVLSLFGTVNGQIPQRPQPQRLVNDLADIFSSAQEQRLEQALVAFADSTSNQIAIVSVPELYGMDKAQLAYQIGEEWGVGQQKFDNGVVILIKPKIGRSRGEVFIATGYGLEGVLTDAACRRIIEQYMIPAFKSNDYFGGVVNGLNVILPLAAGEISTDEFASGGGSSSPIAAFIFLAFMVIVFLALLSSGGKNGPQNMGGGNHKGPSAADLLMLGILSNAANSRRSSGWGGSSGGFGGGFGGGGFGGFGGGGFGGGGAGGSW